MGSPPLRCAPKLFTPILSPIEQPGHYLRIQCANSRAHGELQSESVDKNVQRTVPSAEFSASGQIEETSADSTVRCTSAPFRPIGAHPRQGLSLSPLFSSAFS